MTMIVATHERYFAESVSDRVLIMAEGRIHEQSPSTEVMRHPRTGRARRFLSAVKPRKRSAWRMWDAATAADHAAVDRDRCDRAHQGHGHRLGDRHARNRLQGVECLTGDVPRAGELRLCRAAYIALSIPIAMISRQVDLHLRWKVAR
ncbi:hypothetical protein [Paenirhodobacter sp.]|uniref:hypothetical protein n=1 Tax=Paenirhodobacter sp. TaxID=1965326 RepID=UPI003B4100F4